MKSFLHFLAALVIFGICASSVECRPTNQLVPNPWVVLPIPRYVDYGSPKSFVTIKNVAIVRHDSGPYQTVRDKSGNLVGLSTITEEELIAVLKDAGVSATSISDDSASLDAYDTLILLGKPEHNKQTDKYFQQMKLSFSNWDDPNTSEDDFTDWKDFGNEGYMLKVGKCDGKSIIILAGNDWDDSKGSFYGAGTFYALQSLRQLIVKDKDQIKIKTAEIADKPLMAYRACQTNGLHMGEDNNAEAWRLAAMLPKIKANGNIFWYGFHAEAASRWRYPWSATQVDFFGRLGRFCHERYVNMNFLFNPDFYNQTWAAALTFDGKTKDPLHYDPNHPVEPGFKDLWTKAGYDVKNDIDIVAAKLAQMSKIIGGGARFYMMNEDDVFGLVHPDDKKLFNTETGDSQQDAINYGRARAIFLAALYKRMREMSPDSSNVLPVCPPGNLAYGYPAEQANSYNCLDFLQSFTATLKELGVSEHMPILYTAGECSAEIITNKTIEDWRERCNGSPIWLYDNNFPWRHMGAFENDPKGPHSMLQSQQEYPAGYREKTLYQHILGYSWGGVTDHETLNWCQSQYMWNMLGLDRDKVNALAVRKVCDAQAYPVVKSFIEEFDCPACYLGDENGRNRMFSVTNRVRFTAKNWAYDINYTDDMRVEAQRYCEKFARLRPELEAKWKSPWERGEAIRWLGCNADNFCKVYLAYGYLKGWTGSSLGRVDVYSGKQLRDLLLDAEDLQQRFYYGPDETPGRNPVLRGFFDDLQWLYTHWKVREAPNKPQDALYYVDIWTQGLLGKFFEPASSIAASDMSDGNGWGKVEEADNEKFRTVTGEATVDIGASPSGRMLVRMKLGTGAAALTDSTKITLSAGKAIHEDGVCKPRWICWLLPEGASASKITIKTEKPVRVYAVELFKEKKS